MNLPTPRDAPGMIPRFPAMVRGRGIDRIEVLIKKKEAERRAAYKNFGNKGSFLRKGVQSGLYLAKMVAMQV